MSLRKLFLNLKGGAGSGNFGHSGRPGKVGGSSTLPGVSKLTQLSFNKHRQSLIENFKIEFPQALEKLDLVPGQIKRAHVYGSYATDKELPNDLDVLIEVPNSTNIPGGGLFDMTVWGEHTQIEHKVSFTFAKPEIYDALVSAFGEGRVEGRIQSTPIRII